MSKRRNLERWDPKEKASQVPTVVTELLAALLLPLAIAASPPATPMQLQKITPKNKNINPLKPKEHQLSPKVGL
jgi:hypothetical protein